jgi:hypothetical protein
MSHVEAHRDTMCAPDTPTGAVAGTVTAEVFLTLEEYAAVLQVTPRWLEDHCGPRYDDVVYSRVGRHLRFSPEDRAENKRRFAVWAHESDAPQPDAGTAPLPTDPVELAKLLANLRRVTAPV